VDEQTRRLGSCDGARARGGRDGEMERWRMGEREIGRLGDHGRLSTRVGLRWAGAGGRREAGGGSHRER
jgi:hypothetical protein